MLEHLSLSRVFHHHKHSCRVVEPAIQTDDIGVSRASAFPPIDPYLSGFMIYNQPNPLINPPQFPFGPESASLMLRYDPFEDISIPAESHLPAWLVPGRLSQSDLLLVTGRCEYKPLPSGRPISKSVRLQSRDGPALSHQHIARLLTIAACLSHS